MSTLGTIYLVWACGFVWTFWMLVYDARSKKDVWYSCAACLVWPIFFPIRLVCLFRRWYLHLE